MNNGPVKAITFEQVYKLSKQHAQKFGWSKTNADIRFVAQASSVPALGDLNSEQHAELHAKWTLDLEGDGHPPTVSYEKFKETVARYASRFGHDAMRGALTRYGGQPWAPNIKHAKRQYVIDCMERDIADDIERARRVAGKPDAGQHIDRSKREHKPITIINTINVDDNMRATLADKTRVHNRILDGLNPDRVSLRRRRGPVNAEIVSARTHDLADIVVRFGAHVTLRDGKRGKVTALDTNAASKPDNERAVCHRLVVLMDDLTTRVLEHVDAIGFHVIDIEPYKGGIVSTRRKYRDGGIVDQRQGSGEWIVDALRATREN